MRFSAILAKAMTPSKDQLGATQYKNILPYVEYCIENAAKAGHFKTMIDLYQSFSYHNDTHISVVKFIIKELQDEGFKVKRNIFFRKVIHVSWS